MLAVVLTLASSASDVTSGAVLTLVLPLGLTLIALGIWWYVAVHSEKAPEATEVSRPEAEHPARSTPQ
jgi:cytochrome c biogenesis protein CcdA